jgi:hypothetical protein
MRCRSGKARWRTKVEIGDGAAAPPSRPEQVEQHRAAEAKMRRAGFFGDHPPRDKEHHLASRKCRRESTPQTDKHARPFGDRLSTTPYLAALARRRRRHQAKPTSSSSSVAPTARAPIVAPNRNLRKRNRRRRPPAAAPPRRLNQIERVSLLAAPRARVTTTRVVDGDISRAVAIRRVELELCHQ